MEHWRLAQLISREAGRAWVFILALGTVVLWAGSGPFFDYSDTWQLVINTGTTIVTFLMVFLIQNTQNRDAKAIHLKLDELIKGVKGARTGFVNLEELSDEELERLQQDFAKLRKQTNHEEHGNSRPLGEYHDVLEAAEDAKKAEESPS